MKHTLLLELLTEELPTQAVRDLGEAGSAYLAQALRDLHFDFGRIKRFQTPRRLAWQVLDLNPQQPPQNIERRGPALNRAKNEDGSWSAATLGFAQSCGTTPEALQERDAYLYFVKEEAGQHLRQVLPELFKNMMEALPIAKRMRWGDFEDSFVRPVLSIIALLDDEVIPFSYFGIETGRTTSGHRVHHPESVLLNHALDYENALASASVMADFDKREAFIKNIIQDAAQSLSAEAVMSEALLREVTSLVEHPVAVIGEFDAAFLRIPQEVLMMTMQDNQKTFAVTDKQGTMLPYFIAIANLNSREPEAVKRGNEKVIRPRFEDAQFFWEQDLKQDLSAWAADLNKVTQHAKLGSVADKARRLEALAVSLCAVTGADEDAVRQAARLCKADLLSNMVGEFPELQGVMGMHYARQQGYPEAVSAAIAEHYQPLGASGALPVSASGLTLALAEKIDTLMSGFAVGAKPTGSKDPYALRRNAIALIRMVLTKRLSLDLKRLFQHAASLLPEALQAASKIEELLAYIAERLQHYYREQGMNHAIFQAVAVFYQSRDLDLLDFNARVEALQAFIQGEAAASFLASAKRIRNILKKNGTVEALPDTTLMTEQAERDLWAAWQASAPSINEALQAGDYAQVLQTLSAWAAPLDAFFTQVMVMAEDEALRRNRLALLSQLQSCFLQLADLSEL